MQLTDLVESTRNSYRFLLGSYHTTRQGPRHYFQVPALAHTPYGDPLMTRGRVEWIGPRWYPNLGTSHDPIPLCNYRPTITPVSWMAEVSHVPAATCSTCAAMYRERLTNESVLSNVYSNYTTAEEWANRVYSLYGRP